MREQLDYEKVWVLAQENGRKKAEAMFPPTMQAERDKAAKEYALEFYRQMTHPASFGYP